MKHRWLKISTLSAIALTVVAYGCDSLNESALVGPSDVSEVRVVQKGKGGFTIITETDPNVGTVSGEIGKKGGSLSIGKHLLTVPAGAVHKPTLFTMSKPSGAVAVELTATDKTLNDVGAAGFRVPVKLSLSYAYATDSGSADVLRVVLVKPDGTLKEQPSTLNSADKAVVGTLEHFSGYALALPD